MEEKLEGQAICRLCANNSDKIIGIYEEEGIANDLAGKINQYLPVKVSNEDSLPLTSCWNCASTVLAWHELVLASIEAEKRLSQTIFIPMEDHKYSMKNLNPTKDEIETENMETNNEPPPEECLDNSTTNSLDFPGGGQNNPNNEINAPSEEDIKIEYDLEEPQENQAQNIQIETIEFASVNNESILLHEEVEEEEEEIDDKYIPVEVVSGDVLIQNQNQSKQGSSNVVRIIKMPAKLTKLTTNQKTKKEKVVVEKILPADPLDVEMEFKKPKNLMNTQGQKVILLNDKLNKKDSLMKSSSKTVVERYIDAQLCPETLLDSFPDDIEAEEEFEEDSVKESSSSIIMEDEEGEELIDENLIYSMHQNTQQIKSEILINDDKVKKKLRRKYTKFDQMAIEDAKIEVDGKTYYNCKDCGKSLNSPYTYLWHTKIHTGERSFVCGLCGKEFRVSQGLTRHIRETHEGIKNYSCDLCGRMFATRRNAEEHRRIHTNERPYVCDLCGKAFKQKASLFVHKRSHMTTFPYHCTYCNQGFRARGPLLIHITKHTGEKPYACDTCGRCFRIKYELKRHKMIHSDEKPFSCSICGSGFRQKRYLKNHMRLNHNQELKEQEEENV